MEYQNLEENPKNEKINWTNGVCDNVENPNFNQHGNGSRWRGGGHDHNRFYGKFRGNGRNRSGNNNNQQRGSRNHNNQNNNNFQNQEINYQNRDDRYSNNRGFRSHNRIMKFRGTKNGWKDNKLSEANYSTEDTTGRRYLTEYEQYRDDYKRIGNYNEPLLGYYEFLNKYYSNESFNESTALNQSKNEIQSLVTDNNEEKQTTKELSEPMSETLNSKIKKERIEKKSKKANEAVAAVELPIPKHDVLSIKIKKEKIDEKKSKEESKSSSSSSDSNTGPKARDLVEKIIKNDTSKSEKAKKNKKDIIEKKSIKSSNSSSDETTSDSNEKAQVTKKSNKNKKKKASKKKSAEEEVICLGNLEKIEDLVGEEEETINRKHIACVLCDKKGHTSFFCQMICKNCGDNYHNAKMCEKPANLSRMLQVFMEFNMSQCFQYDPERRFSYRNGNVQTELLPGVFPTSFSDSGVSKKRLRPKTPSEFLNLSRSKKIRYASSDSSSSSSAERSEIEMKRKKKPINNIASSDIQNQTYPGMQFNPLMAQMMAQMMGISPQFPSKKLAF